MLQCHANTVSRPAGALATALLVLCGPRIAGAQLPIRTVAVEGDPIPGGGTFSEAFTDLRIADTGEVTFRTHNLVFTELGGPLGLLVPGEIDGRPVSFGSSYEMTSRHVVFSAALGVGDEANHALISYDAPGYTVLAEAGAPVPGHPAGERFGDSFDVLSLNQRGDILFRTSPSEDPDQVTVWLLNADGLFERVLGVGDTALVELGLTEVKNFTLTETGDVFFQGVAGGSEESEGSGLWEGRGDLFEQVVTIGMDAPELEGTFCRFTGFATLPNGVSVFRAHASEGEFCPTHLRGGLFQYVPGDEIQLIHNLEIPPPGFGSDYRLGFLAPSSLLPDGRIVGTGAATSTESPPNPTVGGIWLIDGTDLELLIRQGDSAPGLAGFFEGFSEVFASGPRIYFLAAADDDGDFVRGLWYTEGGRAEVVLLEGIDQVSIHGGLRRDVLRILPGLDRTNVNGSGHAAVTLILSEGVGLFVIGQEEREIQQATLVGLEVVQSVQDWNNSVVLVEGKPTVVRAHFEAPDRPLVRATLDGFYVGSSGDRLELPGSPLSPSNPGGYIYAQRDAQEWRSTSQSSLYWELPPEWLVADAELELTVQPRRDTQILCLESAGSFGHDCSADVFFLRNPSMEVRFVATQWTDGFGNVHAAPSNADLQLLARRLQRMAPISHLDWTTGSLVWTDPMDRNSDLEPLLEHLLKMRAADGCGATCERIYYGALGGPERGGLGASNAPWWFSSAGTIRHSGFGRYRHIHEIGHNLGLKHAPYCGAGAGTPLPVPDTTTINGVTVPTLGPLEEGPDHIIYGYDTELREVIDPREHFELMAYCGVRGQPFRHATYRWMSSFTYETFLSAIDNRFSAPAPEPGSLRDLTLVSGTVHREEDAVDFGPLFSYSSTDPPPLPESGEYLLSLRDGGGAPISEVAFEPAEFWQDVTALGEPEEEIEEAFFLIAVDSDPRIAQIAVLRAGTELGSVVASANAPGVQVISPNGGEVLESEVVTLEWTASDDDGDDLSYAVHYSVDGGTSWRVVALDWQEESLELPHAQLAGTADGLIRVQASDGFNVATDESDGPFAVANNPPRPLILAPGDGRLYVGDQRIQFEGLALDAEDGEVDPSQLIWSSSLDGPLGTGSALGVTASELAEGEHTIDLTATDSDAADGSATVDLRIARDAPAGLADLRVSVVDLPDPATSDEVVRYEVVVFNGGPEAAPDAVVSMTLSGDAVIDEISTDLGSCAESDAAFVCTLGNMDSGQRALVTALATPGSEGLLAFSADIPLDPTDPDFGNNSASEQTLVDDQAGLVPDGAPGGDTGGQPDAGDGDGGAGPGSGGGGGSGCGCQVIARSERPGVIVLLLGLLLWRRRERAEQRTG